MAWCHYQSDRTNVDPELCRFMESLGHNELILPAVEPVVETKEDPWEAPAPSGKRCASYGSNIVAKTKKVSEKPLHQHPC